LKTGTTIEKVGEAIAGAPSELRVNSECFPSDFRVVSE